MARDTWYRLDNIGKFYSSQAGSTAQTVFRFSATLIDEIDPVVLQQAVDKTVSIFPSFNVCLRSGMFWHYLEQSHEAPVAHPENLPICFGLHVDTRSILFRVSYYKNRINLEVSHIVSDGRGTMNFFKALLYAYIEERYGIEGIALDYDGSDHQKSENSFDKYYERKKKSSSRVKQDTVASSKKPKVYRLTGWRDKADPTYIEYHVSASRVRDLARSYGVSVTSLVIAAIIRAIRAEMPQRFRQRQIRISIPVDLRQVFESTTTKNFFGLTYISHTPRNDESVNELAVEVHEQLKEVTQAEHLKPRMNRMIKLEKSPFLRYAPVFAKDLALDWANRLAARQTTTTVSNLGQTTIESQLAPYVRDINILTSTSGINFVLCSFNDDLCIGISTVYSNLDIIKHFCRFFSAEGIEGHLNINKTEAEVQASPREVNDETV